MFLRRQNCNVYGTFIILSGIGTPIYAPVEWFLEFQKLQHEILEKLEKQIILDERNNELIIYLTKLQFNVESNLSDLLSSLWYQTKLVS